MPCRDYDELNQVRVITDPRTQRRLDTVTRLLCTLCRQLEEAKILRDYGSNELRLWWIKHKEEDARREQAEREAKEVKKRELQRKIKQLNDEYERLIR